MAGPLNFLIFSILFVFVSSKDLHVKQTSETKDKDVRGFMNLFNNQGIYATNKRYVRHIKAVTESGLERILEEIRHKYMSGSVNPNSSIPRLIRDLNRELRKHEHNKRQKEKARRRSKMEVKKSLRKRKN